MEDNKTIEEKPDRVPDQPQTTAEEPLITGSGVIVIAICLLIVGGLTTVSLLAGKGMISPIAVGVIATMVLAGVLGLIGSGLRKSGYPWWKILLVIAGMILLAVVLNALGKRWFTAFHG